MISTAELDMVNIVGPSDWGILDRHSMGYFIQFFQEGPPLESWFLSYEQTANIYVLQTW